MFPQNPLGQKPATTASAFPQATSGTSLFPSAGSSPFQTGQMQQQGTQSLFSSTLAKPPSSTQPTLPFGSMPATATPGGGFGMSAPPTSAPAPSLNFGGFGSTTSTSATPGAAVAPTLATSTPGATTGFNLGATLAQGATTGFNLGVTSTPSATPGFNLGTASTPGTTTGFNLGATSTFGGTTGFNLPASSATTTATGLNLGATTTLTGATPGFNMTATSAAGTLGGFNLSATPVTTAQTGLQFGAKPTTTTPLTFGIGSTLTAASTAAPAFGLATSATVASSAPSSVPTLGGLGGTTSFNIGKGTSIATKADQLKGNPLTSLTATPIQSQANYKDDLIPQELMVLVENFKTFVKDQKSSSSVVNRASLKQITKVTEDAELLKRMTMQLERTVNKNKALNRKLREDVARGIQDSEIVQRLSMDPQGFPTDNTLAFDYFRNIVDRFQLQAESLTVELKNMEKHIVCKLNPTPFTPEELSAIMKQLYECFVALAGRYQSIHSSVTSMKLELQRKKDPWYALSNSNVINRQRHY